MSVDSAVKADLTSLSQTPQPVKRAAYSDRMAWMMASLSQLAYLPFDEESEQELLSLAADLARLADQQKIAELLRDLSERLIARRPPASTRGQKASEQESNAILREVLKVANFELLHVIHEPVTDTQGFIVRRKASATDPGMIVLVFRGTQQVRDWLTNLNVTERAPVLSRDGTSRLGEMHGGFHAAFMSVRDQINPILMKHKRLPLFITGHSLGGALAVIATWYCHGETLAACYTFGAPRVGDDALESRFRTPIYRVVNGADPVPNVPPSSLGIDILKVIARIPELFGQRWSQPALNFLIRLQRFRHYGYQRYLTICAPGPNEQFHGVRNLHGVSAIERTWRHVRAWAEGAFSRNARIDKYHDCGVYRAKLRSFYVNVRKQDL
ncbi:MAG: lipase family protein [Minwuia sp.]|nr:lipase family protein [Minwuia sp.]